MVEPIGRSREGAWIEINTAVAYSVYAARRSREGAWIEILVTSYSILPSRVAPVRERGLKSCLRWSGVT